MDNDDIRWEAVLGYLRAMASVALRPMAEEVLDTYEKALLFSKLDGNTSQLKLQEMTRIPQATISRWVNEFTDAGIVAPPGKAFRNHQARFTLRELRVNMAGLKKKAGSESEVIAVPPAGGE
ncbi:hypothetical protein E6H14_09360 [Candidatus Bathyarchaeota archaeon]|nr:MAG: hypothetical protein E6H14_09360 [Candidatus Bathyarchaeota archaeon]